MASPYTTVHYGDIWGGFPYKIWENTILPSYNLTHLWNLGGFATSCFSNNHQSLIVFHQVQYVISKLDRRKTFNFPQKKCQ